MGRETFAGPEGPAYMNCCSSPLPAWRPGLH